MKGQVKGKVKHYDNVETTSKDLSINRMNVGNTDKLIYLQAGRCVY